MAVAVDEPSSSSQSKPASNGVHYLAKCVLRGTVVLQVVHGHIRSPSSNDVVFGKETSIELVIIGEDGVVQSVFEQAVFGTIKDLAILRWNEKFHARDPQILGKDLLVVISDSGKLSILTFCNEMHRFYPVEHVQLSNPGNSRDEVGRLLAVDPEGFFIAAAAYEDRLAFFSVSTFAGVNVIDKRTFYPPEKGRDTSTARGLCLRGTIWSMCFISKDFSQPTKQRSPLLAIVLNRRGEPFNELMLLEWDTREDEVHVISQYADPGALAHTVGEVPYSYGYAFLFRIGDILLMDLRDPRSPCCAYRINLNVPPTALEEHNYEDSCRIHDGDDEGMFKVAASALLELSDSRMNDPMSIDDEDSSSTVKSEKNYVYSWTWDPENKKNPRMVFCLNTGEHFAIDVLFDKDGPRVSLSDCLYKKSLACRVLLWLESGLVVAIVDMADGMVLKWENERLFYTSPIQNIAPILDMAVVENLDEKHDEMFACCGVAHEGSIRVIRSGSSVEKLLRTPPIYQGITGTWTIRMKVLDSYHSFLVLSFVEQTRILSVGLSFTDVTDSVGFEPDVCTLACGLFDDGLLVQIHRNAVALCLPTSAAHPEGIHTSSPICTSWFPDNMSISLGAVGRNMIVVATSNPCYLFILGIRSKSSHRYEMYEMLSMRLQNELSCISIPQKQIDIDNTIIIGTHKPSVEILSFVSGKGLRVLAVGTILLTNTIGTAISGCIPQDVRLVRVDRSYVLSGLRNGMLLRFEWPTSGPNYGGLQIKDCGPIYLQLVAVRRIGITPVFLVPLSDSLDADIIALSDRPWLLQTARHSLSYTSISFQPSTHVTPVCSVECPKGILFVAESSLHLVEMVHSKRLNVQKFYLGGTPRKVLYHTESRLLVVMRTHLNTDSYSSDVCCMDPLSGSLLSSFKFEPGESGKSMELVRVGSEQVLVIGTSLSTGSAMMSSGEAESTKGRLIVLCLEHMQHSDTGSMSFCTKGGSSSQRASPFGDIVGAAEQLSSSSLCSSPDDNSCEGIKLDETEAWQLRLAYSTVLPGIVLAVCPYLEHYFLASAGTAFYVCGFPNDNPQRVRKFAVGRTRFMIMSLIAHFTRIAVGDCRDGVLFYTYHEDAKKLEQLYCDRVQRLVADCSLMDIETAVASDRKGSIAVLSCPENLEDNASPECNLKLNCSFYMGEIAMRIRKGSFSYKLPVEDASKGCDDANTLFDLSHNSIVASTLLGGISIFIPISRDEYEILEAVQARLVVHPLTTPILGNDHNEFRSRESLGAASKVLDGDMLAQFLELTSMQQEAVLGLPLGPPDSIASSLKAASLSPIPINHVVQLLERVHYALN